MADIQCDASGCRYTNKSGKIFFQCNKCRRWWCSEHGREGKQCPGCGTGYMNR